MSDISNINCLIDSHYDIGVPLCAKYKKSFAFQTIWSRLPIIITKIIDQFSRDKNEIKEKFGDDAKEEIKDIVGRLAKLKNEIQTNKIISPFSFDSPVTRVWNSYIEFVAKKYFEGNTNYVCWYNSPWLFVECYLYARIRSAIQSSSILNSFDPFLKQKEIGFRESLEAVTLLCDYCLKNEPDLDNLKILLQVSLWGNRCDLSLSAGEEVSQKINLIDSLDGWKKNILVDESDQLWKCLDEAKSKGEPITIGYVLDNSGFELLTDLCFADVLIRSSYNVQRVNFYVKTIPWFVSDAMTKDFNWMLEEMAKEKDTPLSIIATRWQNWLKSSTWKIIEEEFWTYPHAFFEMENADPILYEALGKNTALVFKGDLNYRKLVGDINWKPDTPFKESLQGFNPAPLIALRTSKADTISGLRPGLAEELNEIDSNWMNTGDYAVIQFSK